MKAIPCYIAFRDDPFKRIKVTLLVTISLLLYLLLNIEVLWYHGSRNVTMLSAAASQLLKNMKWGFQRTFNCIQRTILEVLKMFCS